LSPHPQNIKMPVWRRRQHTFSTLPMFLFLFFFSFICLNINIFVRNKAKLKYTTGFQMRVIKSRDISFFFSIVTTPFVPSWTIFGTIPIVRRDGTNELFRDSRLSCRTLVMTISQNFWPSAGYIITIRYRYLNLKFRPWTDLMTLIMQRKFQGGQMFSFSDNQFKIKPDSSVFSLEYAH
jgi:hypothetical protein